MSGGGQCERELWCTAAATRVYIRTDHAHYHPGDDRADVPFEVMRTCDAHPMGANYGWRLADPGDVINDVGRHM